ncbi:MAG: excalibur calcium-binding domain-containing protein [Hyphomonadaceae bacterium]
MALGVLIGGGAFLALDSLNPSEARSEAFFLRGTYYQNCRDAFLDGRSNIHRGEPGYRPELDADRDGLACELFLRR